jgi:predicted RNase H-like nuclease
LRHTRHDHHRVRDELEKAFKQIEDQVHVVLGAYVGAFAQLGKTESIGDTDTEYIALPANSAC